MNSSQKIAIVGAGTAGLASAILLSRSGHQVTLFEASPVPDTLGAGILLQPIGLQVLEKLDALTPMQQYGARITGLVGSLGQRRCHKKAEPRILVDSHYRQASPNFHGLGIHRASLCHVLTKTLQTIDVEVRWGCRVLSCESKDVTSSHGLSKSASNATSQAELTFQYQTDNTTHQAEYDAVIIANGAGSQLRPASWVKLDRLYPWGAAWTMVEDDDPLPEELLHQFYHGAHTMMGIMATGSTPDNPKNSLNSLFWSLPHAQLDTFCQTEQARQQWLAYVEQHWPAVAAWLETATASSTWLSARYRDVVLRRWGDGAIGIIGDAAHAMSPQLGQGVNMALVDAWVLNQAINQASTWSECWQYYHRDRASTIRFYQRMSRLLTPLYQSNTRWYGVVRDIGFPAMYHLPLMKKQMALTIAGVKLSAWRHKIYLS